MESVVCNAAMTGRQCVNDDVDSIYDSDDSWDDEFWATEALGDSSLAETKIHGLCGPEAYVEFCVNPYLCADIPPFLCISEPELEPELEQKLETASQTSRKSNMSGKLARLSSHINDAYSVIQSEGSVSLQYFRQLWAERCYG